MQGRDTKVRLCRAYNEATNCGFIFVPTLVAFGWQENGGTVVVLCAVGSGWYIHVRVVYSLLLSFRSEVACSFVGHCCG